MFEEPVEVTGYVAFETASDLSRGLAFGGASGDVVAGGLVAAHPNGDDHVENAIEASVTEPVEAVPGGLSAGGRDRGDAAEHGKRGFAVDAAGVGPGAQDGGGIDCADTMLGEQIGPLGLNDRQDRPLMSCCFGCEGPMPVG